MSDDSLKPPAAFVRSEGDRPSASAPEVSDEELMERFIGGEQAAFDALYRRHAPAVYGFVLRMVRDAALAEDVMQLTFLSFVKARGRYDRQAKVAPWLYAIAGNAARDSLRRSKRRGEEPEAEGDAEPSVQPMVRDPGLEKRVQAALDQLPEQQREAVVLHRFQGLSFAEIAAALGTSVGAVKVRAHRGYEKLQALLAGLERE